MERYAMRLRRSSSTAAPMLAWDDDNKHGLKIGAQQLCETKRTHGINHQRPITGTSELALRRSLSDAAFLFVRPPAEDIPPPARRPPPKRPEKIHSAPPSETSAIAGVPAATSASTTGSQPAPARSHRYPPRPPTMSSRPQPPPPPRPPPPPPRQPSRSPPPPPAPPSQPTPPPPPRPPRPAAPAPPRPAPVLHSMHGPIVLQTPGRTSLLKPQQQHPPQQLTRQQLTKELITNPSLRVLTTVPSCCSIGASVPSPRREEARSKRARRRARHQSAPKPSPTDVEWRMQLGFRDDVQGALRVGLSGATPLRSDGMIAIPTAELYDGRSSRWVNSHSFSTLRAL